MMVTLLIPKSYLPCAEAVIKIFTGSVSFTSLSSFMQLLQFYRRGNCSNVKYYKNVNTDKQSPLLHVVYSIIRVK